MDSTENEATITPTASLPLDAAAIQDSGTFTYIDGLSPLKPLKAAPVVPGFNSPPSVFSSPRPNTLQGTDNHRRPQCPQSCTAELSRHDVVSDEYQVPKTQGSHDLVPCIKKKLNSKGSSPSGGFNVNLVDPMQVDHTHYAYSASLSLMQSEDIPQSLIDSTESNGLERKLDHKIDTGQDAEKVLGAFEVTLEQAMQELQGKPSLEDNPVETYQQGGCGMLPTVCPKVEFDLQEYHSGPSLSQHAAAANEEELHYASQFMPEPLQSVEEHEDCSETTTEAFNNPADNMILHDPMEHHCGMHRRCLRFGEAQLNTTANTRAGFWSPSNNGSSPNVPATEVLESSCLEVRASSSGGQLISPNQPTIPVSSRNNGNSSLTVPKPSGIGLHLNSVINATQYGCDTTGSMKLAEKGFLNIEGRRLVPITGCHQPENTTNSSAFSNVREKDSVSSTDGSHQNESSVATGSLASLSPHTVKPIYVPVLLKPCEYQRTSFDKRKSIYKHADAVEELNPSSTKKKRKTASASNDGDGCKRCNCKKTKCLKLYCDCFAAGVYCAETCACEGCFNRPEYEDTVHETRQQIELRNPLAFAPKIVQHITESPANSNVEDGNASTPSSARHKRGCNCKKSMCLKKYCECYQANVGCSNGCRCEGCKNVYGRNGVYGMNEDVLSKDLESAFDEKLEMFASQDGLLQTEPCHPYNLTPRTPSFQFSDHRKDASKSRLSTRRCLPSPESNLTFLPPYGKSLISRNSHSHDLSLKDRKNIEDISSPHELDYSNIDAVDEFLWKNELLNSCDLTTLPTLLSSENSRRWHNTPITPVAQFSGTQRIRAVDSDKKLHDVLEDDIPDILKDDFTPLKGVKVSSPNKKRVSPPLSSLKDLGSSSSAGLRSGRKYVLRAVPSFAPLTPCFDSKDSSCQNIDNRQDCSSKKRV